MEPAQKKARLSQTSYNPLQLCDNLFASDILKVILLAVKEFDLRALACSSRRFFQFIEESNFYQEYYIHHILDGKRIHKPAPETLIPPHDLDSYGMRYQAWTDGSFEIIDQGPNTPSPPEYKEYPPKWYKQYLFLARISDEAGEMHFFMRSDTKTNPYLITYAHVHLAQYGEEHDSQDSQDSSELDPRELTLYGFDIQNVTFSGEEQIKTRRDLYNALLNNRAGTRTRGPDYIEEHEETKFFWQNFQNGLFVELTLAHNDGMGGEANVICGVTEFNFYFGVDKCGI